MSSQQRGQHDTNAESLLRAQLEAFILKPELSLATEIAAQLERYVGVDNATLPYHLFESAVAQSPLAISITDLKANILYCNDSFTQVTGYRMKEIVGENESVLSYKSTPKHIYREMWEKLSAKETWKGTLVNRRKNGERYLAEVVIAPVLDNAGEVSHYLGIHRDSTELHTLEQSVANQKALIESVVDSAPDAIAVLNHKLKLILDNHAYKKLVGDMRGKEPACVLIDALKQDDPEFSSFLTNRRSFADRVVECRIVAGEALRWFSCSGVWFNERSTKVDDFFSVQEVPYLMLTVHEITTLKRQQEEIRRNAMRALVAEESLNASVRETLAAATYKLQEPLNMLRAAMAMLERRGSDAENPAILDLLEQVSEKGSESLELLQKIMPAAQDEESGLLNLNQVIHEVLQLVTPRLLSSGIVLSWQPDSHLPSITGNARQMRMLLRHLINNAIEAIIGSAGEWREIEIATAQIGNWQELTIRDSGNGIDESLHYKVFEPFFTTKKAMDGGHTGMGLTLVQDAVNAHAGTIEIDSQNDGGCLVRLRFPVTRH